MSTNDQPDLDDVLPVTEQATPDHHEHAKTPRHLNEEELDRRTEQERVEAGVEVYDPGAVPPAED